VSLNQITDIDRNFQSISNLDVEYNTGTWLFFFSDNERLLPDLHFSSGMTWSGENYVELFALF
jgi:hypothetical protein